MVTGPPIRNLGFILKDVSRLWVRYFEVHADQIGMTLTQARVLVFLSRNEGTTQARLAELCDTDPMTLVRVLDRMEREHLLERRPDPNDRRAYRVFLRPAADPVLAEITRIGDKARGEALAGISNEERSQLLALLERIQSNLLALIPASSEPARVSSPTNRHRALRARRAPPLGRAVRSRKTSP
jgi:DNA-binding MarR family transcriptional regulator